MSTLTKGWLLKTIAELEEEHDATPGVVNVDAAMALAAMKLALASLEAEAMTQVLSSRAGNDTSTIDKALPEGTMLYTAPPSPVFVPDELTREEYKRRFMEDDDFDDTFRGGWKAHRAAMLQGAGPATTANKLRDAVETIRSSGIAIDAEKILAERDALNSPVVPDGWVMVPVEPTMSQEFAGYRTLTDTGKMSRLMKTRLSNIYRAMIAAAPQQEVK